jgi:hypothetical protein
MKLPSSRKQRLAIALGVILLLALWRPWQPTIPVQYSEALHQFAQVDSIPTDRFVARWVHDMNQDQFPDLVFALQPRDELSMWLDQHWTWSLFDFEEEAQRWQEYQLSGRDGSLISAHTMNPFTPDSMGGILEIFPDPKHPAAPIFLVGSPQMLVGLAQGSEFQFFPQIAKLEVGMCWTTGPDPAIVFQNEIELMIYPIAGIPDPTTFPTLGHGSDFAISTSVLGLPTPSVPASIAFLRFVDQTSLVPDQFKVFLESATYPDGKIGPKIELEIPEAENILPKILAGMFDQNGDQVSDWLLCHSSKTNPALRWFDGQTGKILHDASNAWASRVIVAPDYFLGMADLLVETSLGPIHFLESETTPGQVTIGLREWSGGKVIWEIPTTFSSLSEQLRLKVTEFDDLDGDGVNDLGITATSATRPSPWGFSDLQFLGVLVSGKTGQAIQ